MTTDKIFATSINCIDGRVQNPISDWIKKNYDIDFVDVVSEPGCDSVLSDNDLNNTSNPIDSLKSKTMISVSAHNSKLVFVSGHHQCAANPVSKDQHMAHIKKAVDQVKSWNLPVDVIGLWVNESWCVETIS